MNTKLVTQIGMREFLRNTKVIKAKVARGQIFEVLERTTPVFRVVPIAPAAARQYQFADLAQFQFSGPADLSQTIDQQIYG